MVETAAKSDGSTDHASSGHRWLSLLIHLMRSKAVRVGFLALVLALLGITLAGQAGTLWHEVQRLTLPVVLLAFALSIAGLVCNLMVWREMLADLGSPLSIPEAWRIYFIGGLSKYVPGVIWPMLAQAELGADRGVPRSRSALSVILNYAVMTCSGAVVAVIVLPLAHAVSIAQYFWILFLIPVGVVLLSPPVLNRLLRLVLRLARLPADQQGVSYRGLARMMVWAIAAWSSNGLFIYVLLRQLAGHPQGTLLVSPDGNKRRMLPGLDASVLAWSKDSRTVFGLHDEDGRWSLVAQDVRSGTLRQVAKYGLEVTPFAPLNYFNLQLSLSPDGKSLAIGTIKRQSDLWILEGFPK